MTESESRPPQDQPEQDDTDPEEGEHLSSPDPGHPVEETEPPGEMPERPHEHPEDIGSTPSDTSESSEQ